MTAERKLMKKIRKDYKKELTSQVISDLDKSWGVICNDLRLRHSIMRKCFIVASAVLIIENGILLMRYLWN